MKYVVFGEDVEIKPIHSEKYGEGFEINWTRMYEAPQLTLDMLEELAEYFGTKSIDVDEISEEGCESCDWGSTYGHLIQVYGATKNIPIFIRFLIRKLDMRQSHCIM